MIESHPTGGVEVVLTAPADLHQGEEVQGKIQVTAGGHEVTVTSFCLRLEQYQEGEDGEDRMTVLLEHRMKGCGTVGAGGSGGKSFHLPPLNAPLAAAGVWWKLRAIAILSNVQDPSTTIDVHVLPHRRIADLLSAIESQLGWHKKGWSAPAELGGAVKVDFEPVGQMVAEFDDLSLVLHVEADGLRVEARLDREEKGALDYLSAVVGGDIATGSFALKDAEVYEVRDGRRRPRPAALVAPLQAFLDKERG